MTTPLEALDALLTAANSVAGLKSATGDRAGSLTLPAVAVGAPALKWETACAEPSEATFPVTLLVPLAPGAIRRLLKYVAALQAALEADTDATITEAVALSYALGEGVTAAGYELTVEYPL